MCAASPGPDAGPFSVVSPSAAVFIDTCPPCGPGTTAPWVLVTSSGASLAREGNIGGLTFPSAASFLCPGLGWMVGTADHYNATAVTRQDQRIVVTDDGGRTWRIQYTSSMAN